MTIGERIAALRRQAGLSQEALGEKLGVSRQSISKWEADANLPEIEKLVSLSRLFGVPVGALLGVEEETPTGEEPPAPLPENGELTDAQLHMVEEIVRRYTQALPAPRARPRWQKILACGLAVALVLWLGSLYRSVERLNDRYAGLTREMAGISTDVAGQIDGIAQRVEDVLKAQNDLTADYSVDLLALDIPGNTATFAFRAVPRRYEENMTARIVVENDGEMFTFGPYLPREQSFSGEFTVPLGNSTAVSVVFENSGVQETQLLYVYSMLYDSLLPPEQEVQCSLKGVRAAAGEPVSLENQVIWCGDLYHTTVHSRPIPMQDGATIIETTVQSARAGLFVDGRLVLWAEPCEAPAQFEALEDDTFYSFPAGSHLVLEEGQVLVPAVVILDNYGREFVQPCAYGLVLEQGVLSAVDVPVPQAWEY